MRGVVVFALRLVHSSQGRRRRSLTMTMTTTLPRSLVIFNLILINCLSSVRSEMCFCCCFRFLSYSDSILTLTTLFRCVASFLFLRLAGLACYYYWVVFVSWRVCFVSFVNVTRSLLKSVRSVNDGCWRFSHSPTLAHFHFQFGFLVFLLVKLWKFIL